MKTCGRARPRPEPWSLVWALFRSGGGGQRDDGLGFPTESDDGGNHEN